MDNAYPSLDVYLRERAGQSPDKQVHIFLDNANQSEIGFSYAELDRRARVIAQSLDEQFGQDTRVLLLFWPGLDFIAALHGALYAGATAIPAYPPEPSRIERTLARLMTIVADAAPAVVLTSSTILELAKPMLAFAPQLAKLPWLAVDTLCQGETSPMFKALGLTPRHPAIIQYTSGSTSRPKGVILSHGNIIANMRMIQAEMEAQVEQGPDRTVVSWTPFYHDLGLMGGVLLPVISGGRSVLMSPLDFMRRPAVWLSTISRYRATDTFVPNFALDIAVRKIVGVDRDALDLSSLRSCIVGAEPVRHASVERFLQAFGKQGLSRNCMVPAYGLAEAVVAVAAGPASETPRTLFIDGEALKHNRFTPVQPSHPQAIPFTSCGRPLHDVQVSIVHPDSRQLVQVGEIGEIWVRGPHVATGYWNKPADTEATFAATLDQDPNRTWLRTGDLGCLEDGHLYVTGRIKDLIILRGRNYYPQDLELAIEQSHARIRPGAVIVFSCERDTQQRLTIIAEVDARHLPDETERQQTLASVLDAIRCALSAHYQLQAQDIVLIKTGSIDKTSSGKLARQACQKRYLKQQLEVEQAWELSPVAFDETLTLMGNDADSRFALIDHIAKEIVRLTGGGRPSEDTRLDDLGLDSLVAMDLTSYLERSLGITIPVTTLVGTTTLDELAVRLIKQYEASGHETAGSQPGTPTPHVAAEAVPLSNTRTSCAFALRDLSSSPPLFCIGGLGGTVSYLVDLCTALDSTRPFIALQAPGTNGAEPPLGSVEEMSRRYINEIRAIQPSGPYTIAGHSFGGLVAFEIAQQLAERGERVDPLLLLDSSAAQYEGSPSDDDELMALFELRNSYRRISGASDEPDVLASIISLDPNQQRQLLTQELGAQAGLLNGSAIAHVLRTYRAGYAAMEQYRPRPYPGPVVLFRATGGFPASVMHPARRVRFRFGTDALGWNQWCPALRVIDVPGDHFSMITRPHVQTLAAAITQQTQTDVRFDIGLDRLIAAKGSRTTGRAIDYSSAGLSFDPYHPTFIEDPYPILHQIRKHDPIHRDARGQWWLTRFEDVSAALRDKRFSADSRNAIGVELAQTQPSLLGAWYQRRESMPLTLLFNEFMLFIDPPRQQLLRQVFGPLFTREAMQGWERYISDCVDEHIADMCLRSTPDLIRDLALPLPVKIMAEVLGFPRGDANLLVPWARDLALVFDPLVSHEVVQRANRSATSFATYLREHLGKQIDGAAKHGCALDLNAALDNGITMDELISHYALIFTAGFETSMSMLGNSALALLRNPDQRDRLRQHPELAKVAVDEFLRFDSAARSTIRYALEDVEIGGQHIRRGDAVIMSIAAANRDPAMFPDPDRLDLGRGAKQHLAFSHGAHYCLGAELARLELEHVMPALARRDIRLVPGGLAWRQSIIFRNLERMRITIRNTEVN